MLRKNLQNSLISLSMLLPFAGLAKAEVNVVTSFRPVHSLVSAVMGETGKPSLIVEGAESPHSYALKPSKATELQDADLIFWIGPKMETFLTKPIETIASKGKSVPLMEIEALTKLDFREGEFGKHDDEEHDDHDKHEDHGDHDEEEKHEEHADHDDHEGHKHEGADPHIWLHPGNAKLFVEEIVKELSDADVENAKTYQANGAATIARIETLSLELKVLLEPVHEKKFLTFHDAYQYFEKAFDLHSMGSVRIKADLQVGAERLSELKKKINATDAACIFSEPQFDRKLIDVLADGTSLGHAVLDPVGVNFETGGDLYFNMMEGLAKNLHECLSQK